MKCNLNATRRLSPLPSELQREICTCLDDQTNPIKISLRPPSPPPKDTKDLNLGIANNQINKPLDHILNKPREIQTTQPQKNEAEVKLPPIFPLQPLSPLLTTTQIQFPENVINQIVDKPITPVNQLLDEINNSAKKIAQLLTTTDMPQATQPTTELTVRTNQPNGCCTIC
ncbi:MAG: hypothetical protein ACON35_08445 [Candidatus Marinamargulisbacteria bacterium]